ncbi:MAG: type I restriction endonuclease subunit R [Acidobacteria bacterium]|nr:type I restriction endonuclease subunit R [Acidobacteriota bacterium]
MTVRLQEADRARVRHHLGYLNVEPVSSIQLGFPAASQPQFLVEIAMDRIIPEAVGMIQKYRTGMGGGHIAETFGTGSDFGVLNTSEDIVVLVDEAHRSHSSDLHANLLAALPNCARIGFTGTPIIMGAKKKTHAIFGEFIDKYTLKQSEEDGATVRILYEGRTADAAVSDGRDLDELFEDMFPERTDEELLAIQQKYATTGNVLEADNLITAKARDMFRHYVESIMPNGLKAQVIASSRLAAIRYSAALTAARDELVSELESFRSSPEDVPVSGSRRRFLERALPSLDVIRRLEATTVISADHNDDPSWSEWSDRGEIEDRVERFKKPLPLHEPSDKADPLAFLCVQRMLLTGFDVPVEQVIYLDRLIREHELLQAIARVNRVHERKEAGLVVDYFGVARHLSEALAVYSDEDIDGILLSIADQLPKLRDQRERVLNLFRERGIDDISNVSECVELLRDRRLRAEFNSALKKFLATLDLVFPRPEGLAYLDDAKTLGHIQIRARNLYRDEALSIEDVGNKIRTLIDEHVVSLGIDPKIPPIAITDVGFSEHVRAAPTKRARASEMEHAIRDQISKRYDEDPVLYQSMSERLSEILDRLEGRWDELALELEVLGEEVVTGRPETSIDLPTEYQPFYALIVDATELDANDDTRRADLVDVTVEIVDHVKAEVGLVGFWSNMHAQNVLRSWLVQALDTPSFSSDLGMIERAADRLLELIKANHERLRRQ